MMTISNPELPELRAALSDGKLDALQAQAEAWLAATPGERAEILADVERRGELARLVHGLDAAATYHEWSAAMFRAALDQIKGSAT